MKSSDSVHCQLATSVNAGGCGQRNENKALSEGDGAEDRVAAVHIRV